MAAVVAAAAAAGDVDREVTGKITKVGHAVLSQAHPNRPRDPRRSSCAAPTSTRPATLAHGHQSTILRRISTCHRNTENGSLKNAEK